MSRVLVTGANGFVGRALCETLIASGHVVRAAIRSDAVVAPAGAETCVVGDIGERTDWAAALRDVDVVAHLAARAHVLGDSAANAGLYMQVNALGTRQLATAAARAGVRRFIFLSSVKVNGEGTPADVPYRADDTPRPADPYGESKRVAEEAVREIGVASSMTGIIVRPPLVYGPGVRANFLRLMGWVEHGVPLPLASVKNRRSLVSVWNLCHLLRQFVTHEGRVEGTWMVSDGEDLSTAELIRRLARAMRRPARLLPVPVALLRLGGALTGRSGEIARLCGSLIVDSQPVRRALQWDPPLSVDEGLERTVQWFLQSRAEAGSHA